MSVTEQDVLEALKGVKYPGFSRDIVSFGIVRDVRVHENRAELGILLAPGTPTAVGATIEREARAALEALGLVSLELRVGSADAAPRAGAPPSRLPATDEPGSDLLPNVKHTIAVASGKGGVGKSTVAVNLAVALAKRGVRVGLLDADIYGPSIPLMMGTSQRPRLDESGRRLVPFERFDVRFMSLGFLVDKDSAVIWRGPMVMKAISQLLSDVEWGDLDVLVVDMPPGTGDAQLTLSQKVKLAGAVIVTTPQDVALADAIKGVAMFRKVSVPILGIVENMSFFACPHCGTRTDIFGHGGGRTEADRLEVPFLGEIAIDQAIRESGDGGTPIVANDPDSRQSVAFLEIAGRVLEALGAEIKKEDHGAARFFARLRKGWSAQET